MEQERNVDLMSMLDLMPQAAFCVGNGAILYANGCAKSHLFSEGLRIRELLRTGVREYEELTDGRLYLTLERSGTIWGASVVKLHNHDVFLLEDEEQPELRAYALAAQELRLPLTGAMSAAGRVTESGKEATQGDLPEQLGRLNRSLFQMLRMIGNMSDAYRYCAETSENMEMRDICSVLRELFTESVPMLHEANRTLRYSAPEEQLLCLTDTEKLERAVYNLLLNAVKFSPEGSGIDVRLARRDNMLYLTVQNENCTGVIPRADLFSRYTRAPGLEDGRLGIGLGMLMVRSAATAHGGTVLVEQSEAQGTRITLTIAMRQSKETVVRSNVYRVDYAGGWDHRLLELAEVLPAELYRKENAE